MKKLIFAILLISGVQFLNALSNRGEGCVSSNDCVSSLVCRDGKCTSSGNTD